MIRCKRWDKGECDAELCFGMRKRVCELYEPARAYKAFGWVVTVRFAYAAKLPDREFHYCGCRESDARRKAMLKSHAQEIISIEPVKTREQWVFAFGNPEEKGY